MKVFGYGRASTSGQVESTAQQEDVCRQCFENKKRLRPEWSDAEWVGFFADEATGRDSVFGKRNAAAVLLAALEPGDVVIVSKMDRLGSGAINVLTAADNLQAAGVRLLVVDFNGGEVDTSTPHGRLFVTMLAGFAEFELASIRERTADMFRHRKRQGLPYNGTPPVGWAIQWFLVPGETKPIKRLVADNPTRRLCREIYGIKTRLNLSYDRARAYCNENKILRTNRKPWTKHTFDKWCDSARDEFVLPNGSHEAAPIPRGAVPYVAQSRW